MGFTTNIANSYRAAMPKFRIRSSPVLGKERMITRTPGNRNIGLKKINTKFILNRTPSTGDHPLDSGVSKVGTARVGYDKVEAG